MCVQLYVFKARLVFGTKLAVFVFLGWQAVIVVPSFTLPLGLDVQQEYAEAEWPIDILVAVVLDQLCGWCSLAHHEAKIEAHYVGNWFLLGAFIIQP